jgi:hypothetical protein
MLNLYLRNAIGPEEANDGDDIANTGSALRELGSDSADAAAQTGVWDDELDSSIRSYQEQKRLDVDGVLLPGGPTETAINADLREKLVKRESEATSGEMQESSSHSRPKRFSETWASDTLDPTFWPKTAKRPNERGDENLSVSEPVSRVVAEGQRLNAIQKIIAAASRAEPILSGTRRVAERDRFAGLGFSYRPDPMGRVGWGEWVDASGRRVPLSALQRDIAPPKVAKTTSAEASASTTIASSLERELAELDRATLNQKRASKIQIALEARATDSIETLVSSANAAIAQATVRDALDGYRIQLRDVAEYVRGPRGAANRDRIRDLLMEAAYSKSSSPEKRHNAQAMLTVHDDAMRNGFAQRVRDPEHFADRVLVNYLAADAGDVAWRISVPGEGDPDEQRQPGDYGPPYADDDHGPEPVGDDEPKLRGSRHPIIREKAKEGRQAHQEFTDRHRPREATEGWDINRAAKGRDGQIYRPDARKPGKVVVDVKPDTESGRRAGENAKAKYERAFGERVWIFYHKGPNAGLGSSSGGAAPPTAGPSGSSKLSSGSIPTVPQKKPLGGGSGHVHPLKGFRPPTFGPWPPRRN